MIHYVSVVSCAAEDVLHSLWSCPKLSAVWGEDIQWDFLQSNVFNNFYSLVQHIMDLGKKFEAFAMLS